MDPQNYLLMTLYGKILRGLFEHERLKPRLKPVIIRTSYGNGNVINLSQLKQVLTLRLVIYKWKFYDQLVRL